MSHHAKLVNHLNELKRDRQEAQEAGQVALVNALSLCIEDTEKEIMAIFGTNKHETTVFWCLISLVPLVAYIVSTN